MLPLAVIFYGMTFVQFMIGVVICAAVVALVFIALRQLKIEIPAWAIQVFWVVVVAFVVITAIHIIAQMW